ncbi:aquaporin-like protein [Aureobasidium pullulans]|uniref:Aquaporin-like protein n=1 Tax=Aureobasidium pullulans TaxID=5580 RepID=A0A4S9BJB2_AURPU|nr:aquaporin-like protein [Aureobasidium pullulans]
MASTGVFFYVYPGIASTASFLLNETNPAFGSLLQVGFAFGFGIAFAIITCAMTICFATWQGFPWKKVPYYIFAQIFGAFMAGLFVYGQYHEQIVAYSAATIAAGKGTVFNGGPASIFCSFPGETQTNLGYLFMIEFFVDTYIGIIIWACLDPANPFVSPQAAPWAIDITISTNMARDLGTRLVALIFFGREAFTYHSYSWISILVNIPATLFATAYYEMLMRDSLQKIGKGAAVHEHGEEGLNLHLTKSGALESWDAEGV